MASWDNLSSKGELTFAPQRSDGRWADRTGYLVDHGNDPLDTPAFAHVDRASYRANSLGRTVLHFKWNEGCFNARPIVCCR